MSDAAQLLLVDERDLEVEVLCEGCPHPAHGGACEVQVEVLRGRSPYGLAYVGTGPCHCCGAASAPTSEEVH